VIAGFSWDGGAAVGAIAIIGGWIKYSMRSMIREESRKENDLLLTKINGTYVRSAGSSVTGSEVERRLEKLEHRAGI
jgi:hypothetical protein